MPPKLCPRSSLGRPEDLLLAIVADSIHRNRPRGKLAPAPANKHHFNGGGILEECREISRPLPDDLAEDLRTGRPDLHNPATWQTAGNCSQVFRLDEAELAPLREAAGRRRESIGAGYRRDILFSLEIASIIAKNTRDTRLADLVADKLVEIATEMSDGHDVYMTLQIVLQAAAAYEDRTAWSAWLDENLARIASAISGPPNRCLGMFVDHLDTIGSVLPVDCWFHRRARFIAASGAP